MRRRLRPSHLPQCLACIRDYVDGGLALWRPFAQQQTRGLKTRRKSSTVAVQLQMNMENFGRKGAWVTVTPGMMRNKWFPQSQARYPTFEEQRAIKKGEIDVVRDFTFQPAMVMRGDQTKILQTATGSLEAAWASYLSANPAETAAKATKATELAVKQIEPSRAIALLDVLLPERLEFERKPLPRIESKSKLPASVQAVIKRSTRYAIYGSVSTHDIAVLIKEKISYNEEAAQIQLGEGNVTFADLPAGGDPTRVKHLGQYEVHVSLRGADTSIRRKVAVVEPKEEAAETRVEVPEAIIDASVNAYASGAEAEQGS